MKKYALFLLIFCPLMAINGCKGKFYKKYEGVAKLQWKRSNVLKYEVNIEDITPPYRLILGLRYISAIKHSSIKVILGMVSPSGKTDSKEYIIQLKDAKGEHLGEAMHDIADREQLMTSDFRFSEKGKYYFTITQATEAEDLGGIMEVGLILDK
jgi:gliding motility-associated lipoprotein GldH